MKLVTPMISINIFFRKDCDQSIQYSRSTNLTSHASLTQLSTDLSLFLEKLMLVFIFLFIYFTIQHLEYIQDEVRHTVRVQQVSIFVIQPVSLLASSSLRALRKQQSSFSKGILCKYLSNCVSAVILKGNRTSSPNTYELPVLFLTLSICLQSERRNCSIFLKLCWSLPLPPSFRNHKVQLA